jgi:hypothetical protein
MTNKIFVIDGKKDEVVGVIMTYISREIHFHTSGIDCLKCCLEEVEDSLFDKTDESQVMQIEKELISLDPLSFERIEDYLAHVKELQLKLGECKRIFQRKMVNS